MQYMRTIPTPRRNTLAKLVALAALAIAVSCGDGSKDSNDQDLSDIFGDSEDSTSDISPGDISDVRDTSPPEDSSTDDPGDERDSQDSGGEDQRGDADDDTTEGEACCPDDDDCDPDLADPDACEELEPIDCELSDWDEWSVCSTACGPGQMHRMRYILQEPENGGEECGEVLETDSCTNGPCAVDCELSDWSPWGECSAECEGGTQSRTRAILQEGEHGGQECPPPADLSQEQACNTHLCPVDCVMGEWGEWSECSAECGGGFQTRERDIITPSVGAGARCGNTIEERNCNMSVCKIDCEVSDWSEWSACDAACSVDRTRSRTIVVPPVGGGAACPNLTESEACAEPHCVADCLIDDEWSEWSECSVECGGGITFRTKDIIIHPTDSGEQCTDTYESDTCNTHECVPVDCEYSDWEPLASCDRACGGGTQLMGREIITEAAYGGEECTEPLEQYEACNVAPCPIDCETSPWSEWSECSVTCGPGGGERTRTRTIITEPEHGGAECPELTRTETCNDFECPIDCTVSDWSDWSECSATCGGGTTTRTRTVETDAEHGGAVCPHLEETDSCNTDPCVVHCEVSEWSELSECNAACGEAGERIKTRTITQEPSGGGDACPELIEMVPCQGEPCVVVDCELSEWDDWSECSETCGGGVKFRERTIEVEPTPDGVQCGELSQVIACNEDPCPVDCIYSDWGDWGSCSAECGGGIITRTRYIMVEGDHGGALCDPDTLEQQDVCNTHECPIDCELSDWSDWSDCSGDCGTGTRTRTRHIITHPDHGGMECPEPEDLTEEDICHHTTPGGDYLECDEDCVMGEWTEWSECSAECGGGEQIRTREIISHPTGDGAACGSEFGSQPCNEQDCIYPLDCVLDDWEDQGGCVGSCPYGLQTQTRAIDQHPENGGLECEATERQVQCIPDSCTVTCEVSEWSEWSDCDESCDQHREREITTELCNAPPELTQTRACPAESCPLDCVLGEWTEWSTCSAECGGGTMTRMRYIKSHPVGPGALCPSLAERTEALPCNTHACD